MPAMADGAYGESLGKRVGAEMLAALGLDLFPKSGIAVTRTAWKDRRRARHAAMPLESAFLLCLELRDLARHPYWVDGRATEMPSIRAGEFTLLDLRQQHASEIRTALDRLAVYLPSSALTQFADEQETTPVSAFRVAPAQVRDDPVIRGLMTALLPALERPEQASRLFLDSVATALLAHLAVTYGDVAPGPQKQRGGLAPWQLRRVQDAMSAEIDSKLSLQELAELCGLSRSHFARAFKCSTGLPPHRWLLARRVEMVKDVLLTSTLPLEQIALRCGFADQSHLSRVFATFAGTSPGEWRRQRRA
jgi:AraC family transcriptional regulator